MSWYAVALAHACVRARPCLPLQAQPSHATPVVGDISDPVLYFVFGCAASVFARFALARCRWLTTPGMMLLPSCWQDWL